MMINTIQTKGNDKDHSKSLRMTKKTTTIGLIDDSGDDYDSDW